MKAKFLKLPIDLVKRYGLRACYRRSTILVLRVSMDINDENIAEKLWQEDLTVLLRVMDGKFSPVIADEYI